MTELPGRVERAFRDHGSFERVMEGRFASTATPFDAVVDAETADGVVRYAVTVRAPSLSAAVDGDVAPVVEEGWHETFERRIADVDGIPRGDHGLAPSVRLTDREVVVETAFVDADPQRSVDDAAAVITYVEGTYVQGIIPGYDYRDPVAGLRSRARATDGR
jgi:hypothetical protein